MSKKEIEALQKLVTRLSVRVIQLESVLTRVAEAIPTKKFPSYVLDEHEFGSGLTAGLIREVHLALEGTELPLDETAKVVEQVLVREAEVRRALKKLSDFEVPDDRGKKVPFFSETFLYDLLGKDDARSVLARLKDVSEALSPGRNMVRDPRAEVVEQLLKDLRRDADHYASEVRRIEQIKKPSEFDSRQLLDNHAAYRAIQQTIQWTKEQLSHPRREPKDD